MDGPVISPIFWLACLLFGLCFGGLGYVLLRGIREAMDQYADLHAEDTARQLEDVFLFIPPRRVLEFARIGAIGLFLAAFLAFGDLSTARGLGTGLFFGLAAGLAALRAPTVLLRMLRERRRQRFNDQLVDALLRMSNALKAGFSLLQAFETVVKEGQNPIAQEFGMFLHQTRVGVRFEDALDQMDQRVGSEDLTLTVRAVEVARLTGGQLTEVFENIAATIRERNRVQGRIRALTAQGRLQGIVVGLLPILLLLGMSMIDPVMITTFVTSGPGIAMLAVVVVLEWIGYVVIKKITNIDV
ncbi:MAG TPA: type II secretion system F family protein [Kiritimatiellia bacterium]|nr:type II secretion system F family protein [Kiritimatiellia bacterium]